MCGAVGPNRAMTRVPARRARCSGPEERGQRRRPHEVEHRRARERLTNPRVRFVTDDHDAEPALGESPCQVGIAIERPAAQRIVASDVAGTAGGYRNQRTACLELVESLRKLVGKASAEGRRRMASRALVVEAGDEPDVLIAERAGRHERALLWIAAEPSTFGRKNRPDQTQVAPIGMRDVHGIEAPAGKPDPGAEDRADLLQDRSDEQGLFVDDDHLIDAFAGFDQRGGRRSHHPGDSSVSRRRAHRRHHRQRHHDVADCGKLDDEDGSGHERTVRPLCGGGTTPCRLAVLLRDVCPAGGGGWGGILASSEVASRSDVWIDRCPDSVSSRAESMVDVLNKNAIIPLLCSLTLDCRLQW
jgi:hypothetical protein